MLGSMALFVAEEERQRQFVECAEAVRMVTSGLTDRFASLFERVVGRLANDVLSDADRGSYEAIFGLLEAFGDTGFAHDLKEGCLRLVDQVVGSAGARFFSPLDLTFSDPGGTYLSIITHRGDEQGALEAYGGIMPPASTDPTGTRVKKVYVRGPSFIY